MRLVCLAAVVACVLATGAAATTIARVTLPEMERQATVIFVGEVDAEWRVPLAGPLPGKRYRFSVERFLRGGPTKQLHLTLQILPGMPIPLGYGHRYLVFARPIHFGTREWRLGLLGYHQAVYRMVNDSHAANEPNGEIDVTRLSQRLNG